MRQDPAYGEEKQAYRSPALLRLFKWVADASLHDVVRHADQFDLLYGVDVLSCSG